MIQTAQVNEEITAPQTADLADPVPGQLTAKAALHAEMLVESWLSQEIHNGGLVLRLEIASSLFKPLDLQSLLGDHRRLSEAIQWQCVPR